MDDNHDLASKLPEINLAQGQVDLLSRESISGSSHFADIIVGIGSSAGGIETLMGLLCKIRPSEHVSYLICQHLSPLYGSSLSQMLAKHTQLPIQDAYEGASLLGGDFFLIPPAFFVFVHGGRLILQERLKGAAEFYFPIDRLFKSMATDFGERCLGVILSGTGNDGVLGASHIKKYGGKVLVQDPQTARFEGMPRQVIHSKSADLILSLDEMPDAIQKVTKELQQSLCPIHFEQDLSFAVDRFIHLLRNRFEIDFGDFSKDFFESHLFARLHQLEFRSIEEYLAHVKNHPEELENLYGVLLNALVEFNPCIKSFQKFCSEALNFLFKLDTFHQEEGLRVWLIGCGRGEETYGLGFLIQDFLEAQGLNLPFKIFSTDLSRDALRVADRAIYTLDFYNLLPKAWQDKYFTSENEQYKVVPSIREKIIFSYHDSLSNAPFSNIHLIICTRFLRVLHAKAQRKIIKSFEFSLKGKGLLALGNHEDLKIPLETFSPISSGNSIYLSMGEKSAVVETKHQVFHRSKSSWVPGKDKAKRMLADFSREDSLAPSSLELIVHEFMDPTVLVSEDDSAMYLFGDLSAYLKPIRGKASFALKDLFHEKVASAALRLLSEARNDAGTIKEFEALKNCKRSHSLNLQLSPQENKKLTLEVYPRVVRANGQQLSLVQFKLLQDVLPEHSTEFLDDENSDCRFSSLLAQIEILKSDLEHKTDELRNTIDKLEFSNQELRRTNEELQAGAEIIHSTNEELQAVNQELYSINSEYEIRIEELADLTNDLSNIYAASEIGTVLIDPEKKIKRFNNYARKIFHFVHDDVGKSIEEFPCFFPFNIEKWLRYVLRNKKVLQKKVITKEGFPYLMRMAPYRTNNLEIKGVLMLFFDIKRVVRVEHDLNATKNKYETVCELSPLVVLKLSSTGVVIEANSKFSRLFGDIPLPNYSFLDSIISENRLEFLDHLANAPKSIDKNSSINCQHKLIDGTTAYVNWNFRSLKTDCELIAHVLAVGTIGQMLG